VKPASNVYGGNVEEYSKDIYKLKTKLNKIKIQAATRKKWKTEHTPFSNNTLT